MIKYVFPFLSAFVLTTVLTVVLFFCLKKIKWAGRNDSRHIKSKNILRVGGIAMILAFSLALIFDSNLEIEKPLWGMIFASWAILIFGFFDDFKEISWKKQLIFQILLASFIFFFGVRFSYFSNPFGNNLIHLGLFFSLILSVFWLVLLMNVLNWLDGVDGLSGGITLIGALVIFFLSLKPEVYQPPMAIISLVLAGVSLGFLVFNFYPAKIIAGTSGSFFMGFCLASLAIFAGAKVATSILILALPIIDFLWVIFERIRLGKSIFKADKNHLHYKLTNLGWSEKKITFVYCLVTILISWLALNVRGFEKLAVLAVFFILAVLFIFWVSKKTSSSA